MLRRAMSLAIKTEALTNHCAGAQVDEMNVAPCSGKATTWHALLNTPNNIPLALLSFVWVWTRNLVRHHNLQIMMLAKVQLSLVLPLLALLATFANAQSSIKYVDIGKITLYICWNVTILVQFSWITWTLVLMGLIPPLVRLLVLHFSH